MVMQDGTLYATKANISGAINATSGSFTGAINATSGKIGGFNLTNDKIVYYSDGNVPISQIDPRKKGTKYTHISPAYIIYRDNEDRNGVYRQVIMGQSIAVETGQKGAMILVESIGDNISFDDNIGLQINTKGSRTSNVALDIVEGDIRVKGQKGYTGSFMVSTGVGGRSIQMFVTNGIITNVAM